MLTTTATLWWASVVCSTGYLFVAIAMWFYLPRGATFWTSVLRQFVWRVAGVYSGSYLHRAADMMKHPDKAHAMLLENLRIISEYRRRSLAENYRWDYFIGSFNSLIPSYLVSCIFCERDQWFAERYTHVYITINLFFSFSFCEIQLFPLLYELNGIVQRIGLIKI